MKLAKLKVEKEIHGAIIGMYCPECNSIRMDILSMRTVKRDYQDAVILQGRCPKCQQKFKGVLRLN